MFQFIGTHTVTRPKECEGNMDVEPPFPRLGNIGTVIGSVSLIKFLFFIIRER